MQNRSANCQCAAVRQLALSMARIMAAVTGLCCLLFLLVCVLTGHQLQHRATEPPAKPTSEAAEPGRLDTECGYHVAFTVVEPAPHNNQPRFGYKLMARLSNTLSSMLVHLNGTGGSPGRALCVHLITDEAIRPHLLRTIQTVHEQLGLQSELAMPRPLTRYLFVDSGAVQAQLERLLPTLRALFTHKRHSYYSNALFFYSLVLHRVIRPGDTDGRLILLDVDIQFDGNLLELFDEFDRFRPEAVIGLAYEQQPVYRHILHEYRREHVNTTAGSAPPAGFPGFNSGVMLLHLDRMRQSNLYNSLLDPLVVTHLCRQYRFRGHLGDQDFYTVAGIQHSALFHVLPCGWNRQLCQWWRFHGYGTVFDQYHRCPSPVHLYHGNCNSALPVLSTYGSFR